MKNRPSPVAYPTTPEDEKYWGFDIFKPVGTPRAWIQDFTSAQIGFGTPFSGVEDVLPVYGRIESDLSKLNADEMHAALALMYRMDIFDRLELLENSIGEEKTKEIEREFGKIRGTIGWLLPQNLVGSPVPLDMIAFFQDFAHTLYGPSMQPHTWFDDEKTVCSRSSCTFQPPTGKEWMSKYCRTMCGGMTDQYMAVEPTLITIKVMDIGDDGTGDRCVHLWTYDPEVANKIPKKFMKNVPDSTREILRERGVKF